MVVNLVELQDVAKQYHGHFLFKHISLKLAKGQCILLTGENGIGKSTLLNIAAGLCLPDAGRVHVAAGRVGYALANFPDLPQTGRQFCLNLLKMTPMRLRIDQPNFQTLVQDFGFTNYLGRPIHLLSKGTKQKLNLIQALMTQPSLLFLDEPLEGLDRVTRQKLLIHLRQAQERGCGMVLISHVPDFFSGLQPKHVILADKTLQPVRATVAPLQRVQLIFSATENSQALSPELAALVVTPMGQLPLKLAVFTTQSDQVILEMLQKNYHLEGIQHG